MKTKTSFFCKNCGTEYAKWQGQCNSCKSWNTITEAIFSKKTEKIWQSVSTSPAQKAKIVALSEIDTQKESRIDTFDSELNTVLGGGLVLGSVTLLGGEPGIGKSTLLLQIALKLPYKILYISGEESEKQIKMRADRIGTKNSTCYILTETHTQSIFEQIQTMQPDIVIIDSIQTLHTDLVEASPGSVSQIRECSAELIQFAKKTATPVILIGHITKDGHIAGPKILEHMVDTVLHFEGDRNHIYRIIRANKNRFGSTSELGIYEMVHSGLIPVENPSEILLSKTEETLSGTAIAATIEGMRSIMVEIQALVSTAVYGTPQRSTTGFNIKRLHMILAVLEKRAGFRLGSKDVFLNITGGISIDDPATDLGVAMAILSSNADIPIKKDICFAAEMGLGGEIRPVQRIEQRIIEAQKLGFKTIFISKYCQIEKMNTAINIVKASKIEDVIEYLFG